MKADGKTYKLKISGKSDTVTFSNIKIGEVWLASGQSNMERQVGNDLLNKEVEIMNANYPDIRYIGMGNKTAIQPMEDMGRVDWKVCSPKTICGFSSVAYFFARSLHLDQKVPVGIIVAAQGGTAIETWISKEKLIKHPDFTNAFKNIDEDTTHWNSYVSLCEQADKDRENLVQTSLKGLELGVEKLSLDDSAWPIIDLPLSPNKMNWGNFFGLFWTRKTFE